MGDNIAYLTICLLLVLVYFTFKYGYKQGQIDCINGKAVYQLQLQENGSYTWEKKFGQ